MRKTEKISIHIFVLVGWLFLLFGNISAQQAPAFTQYFNNPLIINPAFAGTRNALAIDIATRQQWIGFHGAPRSYYAVAHTPVRSSKVSIGASLMADKAGPVNTNHFSLAYSYLLRINHRTFLSMGLNTGFNNFWIGLSDLDLVQENDPFFEKDIENTWKPTFGSGLVVFTPSWYVSVSAPQIPLNRINGANNQQAFSLLRTYYVSAGYYFYIMNGLDFKLSWMGRFADGFTNHDLNSFFTIKDKYNLGITYRLNTSVAFIAGAQITPNIGVFYSYDFPVGGTYLHNISNQEITVSFDITKFYVRNRDREFLRKKPSEEERAIRSIRYF